MGANGIYGLSGSGLDIESLVKMGMLNKQNQYDKMYQKEVKNTWTKEAYNDVYTKISDLKNSMSTYKMQSNMNAMQASSSDNSVVTATANGAAAAMAHKVSVTSVASNAYIMTGMNSATGEAYTIKRNGGTNEKSSYLADVIYKKVETGTKDENGKNQYTVTREDGSVSNVKGDDIAIKLVLKDSNADDAKTYTLEYTYDDLIQDKKTLYDMASAISKTGANIQGGYDSATDSFSFYNKTSGADNIVSLGVQTQDTAMLLNNMHLASYSSASNTLTSLDTFVSRADYITEIKSDAAASDDIATLAGYTPRTALSATDITQYNNNANCLNDIKHYTGSFGSNSYNKTNYDLNKSNAYFSGLKTSGADVSTLSTTDSYYWESGDASSQQSATGKVHSGSYNAAYNNYSTKNLSCIYGSVVKGEDIALSFTLGNGTDTTTISFSNDEMARGMTLQDLADKINNANLSGVQAKYDSTTKEFSLYSATGTATLDGGSDAYATALVNNLNLTQQPEPAGEEMQGCAGTDATVTIDGKTYQQATNVKTVAGVTYTFTDVTEAGKTATVNVTQDTNKIVDYVKEFVEAYNSVIDYLNEKLSETKYTDYAPLTKQQESEMSETQVTKWNEKAKSGLLYNNSIIRSVISSMREAVYTPVQAVDSKYNSLSAIGITTSNTKGHITFDEDKLMTALADDPDCVYQLFASDQDTAYISGTTNKNKLTINQKNSDYSNTGVANRLYNLLGNSMSTLEAYAGTSKSTDDQSYLGKMITNLQTKMSTFKTQMSAYETLLYKKYDAMEVALSKLGTQLGYITGYGS